MGLQSRVRKTSRTPRRALLYQSGTGKPWRGCKVLYLGRLHSGWALSRINGRGAGLCTDQERKCSEGKLRHLGCASRAHLSRSGQDWSTLAAKVSSRFLVDALSCMMGLVTEKEMPASASQFSTVRGSMPQEGHAQGPRHGTCSPDIQMSWRNMNLPTQRNTV